MTGYITTITLYLRGERVKVFSVFTAMADTPYRLVNALNEDTASLLYGWCYVVSVPPVMVEVADELSESCYKGIKYSEVTP